MRQYGNLNNVKPKLLLALKTNFDVSYKAINETEHSALQAEVDRLLFPNNGQADQFLCCYVEPQLSDAMSIPENW